MLEKMKKMLLLVFVLCSTLTFAQFNQDAPWMSSLKQTSNDKSKPAKFQDIVDACNTYWETRDPKSKREWL